MHGCRMLLDFFAFLPFFGSFCPKDNQDNQPSATNPENNWPWRKAFPTVRQCWNRTESEAFYDLASAPLPLLVGGLLFLGNWQIPYFLIS